MWAVVVEVVSPCRHQIAGMAQVIEQMRVQVILHMLEIGAVQFFHDPLVTGTADIQEPSRTHEIVSRSKTELRHRFLPFSSGFCRAIARLVTGIRPASLRCKVG